MLLHLLVSMIWPTQAVFYLVSVDAMHLPYDSDNPLHCLCPFIVIASGCPFNANRAFHLIETHRCISSPTGTETNPHSCRDREGEALPATFPRDRTCVLTLSGVKATSRGSLLDLIHRESDTNYNHMLLDKYDCDNFTTIKHSPFTASRLPSGDGGTRQVKKNIIVTTVIVNLPAYTWYMVGV
uniref:Uncharacterized protein n=1 Tax=Salix viminalis TaxID=40686 RepID=A0A6N2KEL5_SALVM